MRIEQVMNQISMSGKEVSDTKVLLAEVMAQYKSVEDACFLNDASVIAHELPRRARQLLNDFKHQEPPGGACLIRTYPIDDRRIGLTPKHWKQRLEISPTLEEELLMVLFGSLLGDVIAWATQQDAYILHDVIPIEDDENSQISTGSQQLIWWHNEDAFHPFRGDYVSLMCLRNPDRIPTTLASTDQFKLSKRQIDILFEPRFTIDPDESHAEKHQARAASHTGDEADTLLKAAYEHISEMHSNPPKLAVLYGDPEMPYVRIDPYFMHPLEDDEAQSALNALVHMVDGCLSELVLQSGDFLFIDNYRAVHGRKPFKARYDGTDRWLKRMNVTRDLRKSRSARTTCASRVIY
jgi:Fe(II)/alpha-ketoglutarate-dependent arginine beta-hydroxylase